MSKYWVIAFSFITASLLGLQAQRLVFPNAALSYDEKVAPMSPTEPIKDLEGVGIVEKRGSQIDLNLKVKNELGELVTLGSFFDGRHPVILSPVYFSCPGLCNFHLNGVVDTLKKMEWQPGKEFQIIAFSFDSKETSDVAQKKKENYLKMYGKPNASSGFHFVTADEATVQALTQSVGFNFKWSEISKEWAHSSAAIVLTPKGVVSRYLGGVAFEPETMKLALNEAASGKIGNIMERVALYCYQYDPHKSKYALATFRVVQLGGGLMVLLLALWLLPVWWRTRKVAS
jgi:protein SCO1/2